MRVASTSSRYTSPQVTAIFRAQLPNRYPQGPLLGTHGHRAAPRQRRSSDARATVQVQRGSAPRSLPLPPSLCAPAEVPAAVAPRQLAPSAHSPAPHARQRRCRWPLRGRDALGWPLAPHSPKGAVGRWRGGVPAAPSGTDGTDGTGTQACPCGHQWRPARLTRLRPSGCGGCLRAALTAFRSSRTAHPVPRGTIGPHRPGECASARPPAGARRASSAASAITTHSSATAPPGDHNRGAPSQHGR